MSEEMELNEDFAHKVKVALSEGDVSGALSLFADNKNASDIENNTWDLVPIIIEFLNKNCETNKPDVFNCCNELLDVIANRSNPEEALFQMIEAIETAKEDVLFLSLLKPLWKLLVRTPKKRTHSLAWCFNAIHTFLSNIETPENYNLSDNERLLMDTDPAVERITLLYFELLPFYDNFLKELLNSNSPNMTERKRVLCKFLLQLLGHPLAYLDMRLLGVNNCSRARRIAENIIDKIRYVLADPYPLLELMNEHYDSELYKPNNLSLGTFFYLILAEKFINSFPKVYNPVYIFQNCLYLVTELLKYENQFIVEKGLLLVEYLIKSIAGCELSYQLLDLEEHCRFCKAVSNVIVFNQLESQRKFALKLLHVYLYSFETRGRYLLVFNLLKCLNHTGLIGYIITQYKEMIADGFKKDESNLSVYFRGERLWALLKMFCYLHKGEESDLIELADQIIAALNLLRYLAIRDKRDRTKIWKYFTFLENTYFEPLKRGLMLSREHYELKMKDVEEEKSKGCGNGSKVNVTVAGKDLPNMSSDQKLEVLRASLVTFDVIESLLSRLKECIEMSRSSKCDNFE